MCILLHYNSFVCTGVLYFDFTVLKNDTRDSMVSLTFRHSLNQALDADRKYKIVAFILKEKISVKKNLAKLSKRNG